MKSQKLWCRPTCVFLSSIQRINPHSDAISRNLPAFLQRQHVIRYVPAPGHRIWFAVTFLTVYLNVKTFGHNHLDMDIVISTTHKIKALFVKIHLLTVISGNVFFIRLYIFRCDCRSPIVRSSLAPSLVSPFDFSLSVSSSRTLFT